MPSTIPQFLEALYSVQCCMSKDNSRYAIAGVLADPCPQGLRLVATDGHRLAIALVECDRGADDPFQLGLTQPAILPASLVKLLTKGKKFTAIQLKPDQTVVVGPDGEIRQSYQEGQFPPYRDVIPKELRPGTTLPPVSPTYLKEMVGSANHFRLIPSDHLRVEGQVVRGQRPVVVLRGDLPNWVGILMPLTVKPEWFDWSDQDAKQVHHACGVRLAAA